MFRGLAVMMRPKHWLLVPLCFAFTTAGSAQSSAERSWGATLREDAHALHEDIAANHPGPVNPEDPGFARLNDAQLATALERAHDARSYADYFFALREYVAAFDDGHMSFGAFGATPNDFRWPGFVTDYDRRGAIRVVHRNEDAPVPLGAELIGCDGLTAEQYSGATLGRMWGRWQLEAQRRTWGRFLFLDEGSRYIPQARNCTFDVNGQRRSVTLAWRPIAVEEAVRLVHGGQPRPRSFDARILNDGTRWYTIPSFDGDPQSSAGQALPAMIAAMRADRAALARAPAIVLDLRGNGGGSSDWSRQIADILWDSEPREGARSAPVHVDWRVSRANLEAIQRAFARQNVGALPAEMRRWYETVIQGMSSALARGDQLWRHPPDEPEPNPAGASGQQSHSLPLAGPVYFITDASCASACLDAVDHWRGRGAVHVGRTTSADTLYMEIRQFRLPSGLTAVSMPMKVYRGRPRGSNEPVVPTHVFDGDIDDTGALERWIAILVASHRN